MREVARMRITSRGLWNGYYDYGAKLQVLRMRVTSRIRITSRYLWKGLFGQYERTTCGCVLTQPTRTTNERTLRTFQFLRTNDRPKQQQK